MKKEERKSGISVVGDVPWGTHLCQFYKTKEDLLDILVLYFKAGLENNEFCMWVTSEPLNVEEAKTALGKVVKDLDDYIKKGQIEILDYRSWYTKSGKFDSDRVLKGWIEKENYALQNGFDGLRLTRNTFWLEKNDWDDFKSYEETVNDVIDKHRMIAICSYSLEKCNASEIIDVVSNHQFAIIRRESKWNIIESSKRKKAEEILNEKTILYETLVNTSPEAITVTDLEGRITYLSSQTLKLLGYDSAEELLGHNAFEFIAPEDHEKAKIALQQTFIDSGIRNFECTAVRKDGTRIILEESTVIIRDSMGNQKSFMAIAREITDRKKAVETVRESEKRINAMMNSITESIFLMDVHGIILAANNTLANRLGTSIEKLKGPCIYDHLPPDVQKRRKEQVAEVIRTGKSVHFEDVRFDRKMDCIFYPLFDSNGRVSEIAVFAQDITERKRMEKSLRFDSEILANLIEGINLVRADDGVIVYANRQFEKMFGYDSGELIKKPISIVNAPIDISPEETAKVIMDSLNKNGVWSGEIYNIKKDGTPFWCYVSVSKFTCTDYGTVWISLHQDITERKKAEENLRYSEEKYRRLFDSSPNLIIETDENGNILAINPMMVKSIGAPSDKLIGKSIFDIFPKEVAEERAKIARKALKEMKNQESEDERAGRYFQNIYVPIIHPDGRKTIQLIARETTDQKKAEEALREGDEKWASLTRNTNDIIMIVDSQGILQYINKTLPPYTPKETIGKTIYEYVPKDNHDIMSNSLTKVFKTGEQDNYEVSLNIPKIGTIWFSTKVVPVKRDGAITDVILISTDITEHKRAEEIIVRSEKKFRELANSLPEIVYETDEHANFTFVNQTSLSLTGYTQEDFKSLNPFQMVAPIDRERVKNNILKVLQGKMIPSNEYLIQRKDGTTFPALFHSIPIIKENKIAGFRGFAVNITERKKAEDVLRQSEEQYRLVTENASDVIWTMDLNLRFIYISPSNEKLTGYTAEKALKLSLDELLTPESTERVLQTFTAEMQLENSEKKDLSRSVTLELNEIKADGTIFPVEARVCFLRDANHNPIGILGITRDVTERKKVETSLRESEKKYRSLIQNSKDSIVTIDLKGNVKFANEATKKLTGYSFSEGLNMNVKKITPFRYWPKSYKALQKAKKGEVIPYFESVIKRKDGKLIQVETGGQPILKDGKVAGVQIITRDITERKNAEEKIKRQNIQLKKLDNIKTDFLNTTSHELRTPVASIKGYIQILLKQTLGEITEEQKKALEVLLRNTNRLDHLIQDILDISRLESGTMKFITEKTDVTKMIKEIAETMQASADLKRIKINVDIQKGIPDLMIDQERVKQVLMNLVDNAIKFSPDNSLINIYTKVKKNNVLFEVQDFGRGIPKNKQKKIFERFYQVDSGIDRKFGGVGLGLTISKKIIEIYGGQIWVDSTLGKGSSFKFSVPLQSAKNIEGDLQEIYIESP